jgi:nucleotide-binding universal stress UspA family protein
MMKTILLPLDGSPLAEQALPYAASLARRSGARIILVRATQAHTILDVDASEAQLTVVSRAERHLEATAAQLRADGIEAEGHVYYDSPVPAILDAARRHHVGLIAMSTHGRSGLGRMIYGSVADDILRHAEVPVLLVPPSVDHAWPTDRPLTILVPLDGSALAEEALGSAELLAELLGARLHLLRVVEPPSYPLYGDGYVFIPFDAAAEARDARSYLEALVARLVADGRQADFEVTVGHPNVVVARAARECQADVVAMATHGRGGLARLVLGSVTTGTLQRTHAPLLLTRPAALERTRPLPLPRPEQATAPEAATITLSLSPAELALLRHAAESMLLSARREEHVSDPLRVILGRLRVAEQGATPTPQGAVGTR